MCRGCFKFCRFNFGNHLFYYKTSLFGVNTLTPGMMICNSLMNYALSCEFWILNANVSFLVGVKMSIKYLWSPSQSITAVLIMRKFLYMGTNCPLSSLHIQEFHQYFTKTCINIKLKPKCFPKLNQGVSDGSQCGDHFTKLRISLSLLSSFVVWT